MSEEDKSVKKPCDKCCKCKTIVCLVAAGIIIVLLLVALMVLGCCAMNWIKGLANDDISVSIVAICCLCALGICGMICCTVFLVKLLPSRKRSEPSGETMEILRSAYKEVFPK